MLCRFGDLVHLLEIKQNKTKLNISYIKKKRRKREEGEIKRILEELWDRVGLGVTSSSSVIISVTAACNNKYEPEVRDVLREYNE